MRAKRLRELAFLNSGLAIRIADLKTEQSELFEYKGGLAAFVQELNTNKTTLHNDVIAITNTDEKTGTVVEVAMQWSLL